MLFSRFVEKINPTYKMPKCMKKIFNALTSDKRVCVVLPKIYGKNYLYNELINFGPKLKLSETAELIDHKIK